MRQTIILSKQAFDSLTAGLSEIKGRTDDILNGFLLRPASEVNEVKRVLNDYVLQLDGMIHSIITSDSASDEFPYAIAGSEVVLEDTCCQATYCYRLISPLKEKIDLHEISFLSPMGQALLFKKVNDQFSVKAPGGEFVYKILSVKIAVSPEDSLVDYV